MIFDEFGKPVKGSTLGVSIRLIKQWIAGEAEEVRHQQARERVDRLRRSVLGPDADRAREGDTITVRIPKRYTVDHTAFTHIGGA